VRTRAHLGTRDVSVRGVRLACPGRTAARARHFPNHRARRHRKPVRQLHCLPDQTNQIRVVQILGPIEPNVSGPDTGSLQADFRIGQINPTRKPDVHIPSVNREVDEVVGRLLSKSVGHARRIRRVPNRFNAIGQQRHKAVPKLSCERLRRCRIRRKEGHILRRFRKHHLSKIPGDRKRVALAVLHPGKIANVRNRDFRKCHGPSVLNNKVHHTVHVLHGNGHFKIADNGRERLVLLQLHGSVKVTYLGGVKPWRTPSGKLPSKDSFVERDRAFAVLGIDGKV